ncbi:MAG: response regulator transcription factor [Ruminococcaceae bacterium]|nr:response regulator transcription factor [Oscillospiraceae bacterium]
MYNILVCDDERDIVSALQIYLESDGYNVLTAFNGKEALDLASKNEIHLILMDIMMPEMDGITAMVTLRESSNVPVILLTAKSEDTDKILGLNVGADDYITKPFNPVEMLARVRSQIRRYTKLGGSIINASDDVISIGGISLNDAAKIVTVDGEEVALTPTEYEILKLLMQNKGRVMSQKEIYESVRKELAFGAENTIAVHIRHLREKIEINPSEPRYIKVVWAHGYKFEG